MTKCVEVAAAIIIRDKKVLIAKRPKDKHQGGLWEFPGGKIETCELAEEALQREIQEEVNLSITAMTHFKTIDFEYPDKKVSLQFFVVTNFSGEAKGLEGQQVKWVAIKQLIDYQFPAANQTIVEKLVAGN